MNRSRDKSTAAEVKRRISKKLDKQLWTFGDFSDLEYASVAASLSRMSKRGELRRVRRGGYYVPKKTALAAN